VGPVERAVLKETVQCYDDRPSGPFCRDTNSTIIIEGNDVAGGNISDMAGSVLMLDKKDRPCMPS
jgi:hypothetical protein